jgi:hypothetical protein
LILSLSLYLSLSLSPTRLPLNPQNWSIQKKCKSFHLQMQQKWRYTIMHTKIIMEWFPNHLGKSWSLFGRLWTPESLALAGAGVACVALIRMPTTAHAFPCVHPPARPPQKSDFCGRTKSKCIFIEGEMYFHFYLKVNTLNLNWIFYAKKISKISPKKKLEVLLCKV